MVKIEGDVGKEDEVTGDEGGRGRKGHGAESEEMAVEDEAEDVPDSDEEAEEDRTDAAGEEGEGEDASPDAKVQKGGAEGEVNAGVEEETEAAAHVDVDKWDFVESRTGENDFELRCGGAGGWRALTRSCTPRWGLFVFRRSAT